ncbi:pyridine nucleotide-disulfide oxidoreductase-domain-containing protein [Cladochytrium replicatum]|nr:pyridine nucleotide-disulfide oxidoreductase-domain-containing protein [Cladochytrium replicatum]
MPIPGATTGAGFIFYDIWEQRNPPKQFEWDPKKKTLAILGSGWAAASMLQEIDTENFNVVVVSPRNYFLFTPLLPSTTVGTVELRSVMMPLRYLTRHKKREVLFVEADCNSIDPINKAITIEDNSEIKGTVSTQTLKFDFLVVAVGAQNATFGIKGVTDHACFLKEVWDARKIRTKLMDCLETACFPGQSEEEIKRILNMIVVGGGPTGVEYAAELHDFLNEDLTVWYPEIAGKINITLVEALPHVLPSFSKELIAYTEDRFAKEKINIMSNTMVKEVKEKEIVVQLPDKSIKSIPYGLLVWATGNTARPVVQKLIQQLPIELQNQRRGLVVDEFLGVKGTSGIYALGDATATKYPPTAQVATRQGYWMAKYFNGVGTLSEADQTALSEGKIPTRFVEDYTPFAHKNIGSLAYIGSDRAIADFPGGFRLGGLLTYYIWRSVYLSNLFSLRNRTLVIADWIKMKTFGRDIARE